MSKPMSRTRLRSMAVAGAGLLALTCSFPTDKSSELQILVTAQNAVVVRGRTINLYAQALRNGEQVKNVDFRWESANPQRATVQKDSFGRAVVTGVNPGRVNITAIAVGYEEAFPGIFQVRVANELEVDSVLPGLVQYGEQVLIKGVGLRNIFIASLGDGALVPDTFSFGHNNATGLDSMRFWVPPPSRSDRLFVLGPGLFGLYPDTTLVVPIDLYEFNDTIAAPINLSGARNPPWLPATIQFFNPGLFFEPIPRDSFFRADWYELTRTNTNAPFTLVVDREEQGTDSSFVFLSDSIYHQPGLGVLDGLYLGPNAWLIGAGFGDCRGYGFGYLEVPSKTSIYAFSRISSSVLHQLSFYQRVGGYQLLALNFYLHSDPRILPDRYDVAENDICNFADSNFNNTPALRIVLNPGAVTGFQEILTIDNPHDLDWYRFRVPDATGGLDSFNVTVAIASRPISSADSLDDIDFQILDTAFLNFYGGSFNVGSNETLMVRLEEGDYYLLVTDYLGVPMRYSLCIAAAPAACTLLPVSQQVLAARAPTGRRKPTWSPARAARAWPSPARGRPVLSPRFRP